jgi:hypothetical protein
MELHFSAQWMGVEESGASESQSSLSAELTDFFVLFSAISQV